LDPARKLTHGIFAFTMNLISLAISTKGDRNKVADCIMYQVRWLRMPTAIAARYILDQITWHRRLENFTFLFYQWNIY